MPLFKPTVITFEYMKHLQQGRFLLIPIDNINLNASSEIKLVYTTEQTFNYIQNYLLTIDLKKILPFPATPDEDYVKNIAFYLDPMNEKQIYVRKANKKKEDDK